MSTETAAQMHLGNAGAASKPCEECGSHFVPTRHWARFCKPACRNEFHRKKALGPDGRLKEVEQRLADLERRVSALDRPVQ